MTGTSAFPGSLDDFALASPTNLGDDDSKGRKHDERHDDIEAAMESVQAELGTDPAGYWPTVKENIYAKTYWLCPAVGEYASQCGYYQTGFVPTLNRLFAVPMIIPRPISVDGVQFYLQTAEASSFIRTGIYANDASTDRPGSLIVDAGQVDTSTGGAAAVLATFTAQALSAGVVWVVVVAQGASSALRLWGGNTTMRVPSTYGASSSNLAKYVDSVTGALPDPFGTPGTSNITMQPYLALRRSA